METGTFAIIRTKNAGVFLAKVMRYNWADEVIVADECYRIWRWEGGCLSCSELATRGPDGGRIGGPTDQHIILGVVEVIPAAPQAIERIKGIKRG